MNQVDFILMANNMKVHDIHQDEIGNTIIELRDLVHLSHNYKKKNLMTITFIEDQSKFKIPDRKSLEDIYRMHLENTDLTHVLRKYCDEKLESI